MKVVLLIPLVISFALLPAHPRSDDRVSFSSPPASVDVYDFVEIVIKIQTVPVRNPFTDATVTGTFIREGGPVAVDGFCDSQDGTVYRIRFMPVSVGKHSYTIKYQDGGGSATSSGMFEARPANRRGMVRIDKSYPFHFVWEGTGEHYFWNSTTTYSLAGWDEETIRKSLDRLHGLKVNRVRVALMGARVKDAQAWYENVYPTKQFTFLLNPWIAQQPNSVEAPGFDVSRFNVDYWQKYERLLRYARDKDMVVSVIFFVDGRRPGVDPFGKAMGGSEEQRYYRYAAARLSAFSNVMWDVTNEYRLFRDDAWAEKMGMLLKEWDPYDHLTSIHGHGDFRFRNSPWADFAMYQMWDEAGGYQFMANNRSIQELLGRKMPQVNEEYGYEDHYPQAWGGGRKAPTRSADTRRRLAWEMTMAGCYQTTGERADTGTGWGPDTGGGWVNGRGDDSMVMLKGYAHMVAFFTQFEWWKAEPHNELVPTGRYCLAEPGRQYAVYLRSGGTVTLKLQPGRYQAGWFNPRTGQSISLPVAEGPDWVSPVAPDKEDWALLLRKQ
jgi:Protein of unknown function (DUF4038)/Domain of unknown function (DUF5060)/Putative collagen-binding domain of a collagenase